MSTPEPPTWPHCAQGADPAADPVGCRGIHIPGHISCLAHLTDADRDAYLTGLTPGDSIDHRGTTFTEPLLLTLLNALRDPATEKVRLGSALFGSATFGHNALFGAATFRHNALFWSATFRDDAWFESATFEGRAGFESASFEGEAWFPLATFEGIAGFESATFEGIAGFGSATFESDAGFRSATFEGDAVFRSATFEGIAGFESAAFERNALFGLATFVKADRFGPLVCAGRIGLSGATFGGPVTLSFAARRLECRRTRWSATAEIRLRYATVDFAHAVFEYPLTIAAEPDPFVLTNGSKLAESTLAGAPART